MRFFCCRMTCERLREHHVKSQLHRYVRTLRDEVYQSRIGISRNQAKREIYTLWRRYVAVIEKK